MKFYFLQNHTINNPKRGFSLVETLIAVSIFSLAISSVMVVLGNGIVNTNYAKRKAIASFLAIEGIETIRNLRDTYDQYALSLDGFVDFRDRLTIAQCEVNQYGCYFDIEKDAAGFSGYNIFDPANRPSPLLNIYIAPCAIAGCSEILYNTSNGKYTYTPNGSITTPTGMYRTIKMETSRTNPNELKIISTVYWTQGTKTNSISYYDTLFNWIQ